MIDWRRSTEPERDVIKAALRHYIAEPCEQCMFCAAHSEGVVVGWERYVAAELLASLAGW